MYKVLVCDDEKDIVSAISIYLTSDGYEVIPARNGLEALDIVKHNDVHLVLMDIMMPEMNGYEAAKAIRAMNDRPDGKNIPIIAMTANSFAEDVQASLDAGMNAHLAKPLDIEKVKKTICEHTIELYNKE